MNSITKYVPADEFFKTRRGCLVICATYRLFWTLPIPEICGFHSLAEIMCSLTWK